MQYNWTVKHLNSDKRGYASDGYFEMEGINADGKKFNASISISFGGEDLKPMLSWQQTDIDAYAETLRAMLETQIDAQAAEIATLKGN